jgi:TPP-dependent pyruvate/acetoin dehydrogenase alpha subunit
MVEYKTFRQRGHGEHDDAPYVPKAMREYWEARDPLLLYARYLTSEGGVPQTELDEIDDEAKRTMDEAVAYAEQLPLPKPEAVTERLFAP